MHRTTALAAVAAASVATCLAAPQAFGAGTTGWSSAGTPNPRVPGVTSPNKLSPELIETAVAQGSMQLENPRDGVGYYGYDSVNGSPALLPIPPGTDEAQKTEPDKNTYLRLLHQTGPDASYDYGTHFLFQGHEAGAPGYVTRVNLDADVAHRVTLMATQDTNGDPLPTFDGSTWDPFAERLLFTAELGCDGGVWQGQPAYSPHGQLKDISGAVGRGGYEGIQVASDGSLYIVEDVGGTTLPNTSVKVANSYVYRFVPERRKSLLSGKLQVLQVLRADGAPMDTKGDAFGADLQNLHTYGESFATKWVTIHNTATDGRVPFCATTLAEARGGTEFKRPENGMFRPGTDFRQFFFTETGDTNADSTANNEFGGWGGVFRLRQASPSARTGRITIAFRGNRAHTGLDNLSFASRNSLLVVEDAGDTLHGQRNALDSGYVLDVRKTRPHPVRFLAEGRDPSATIDAALGDADTPGFTNDGDNEVTGIHISDGRPSPKGLLGREVPTLFHNGFRAFWTQQHGDNVTYELLRSTR